MSIYNRYRKRSVFGLVASNGITESWTDKQFGCGSPILKRLVSNNGPYPKYAGRLEYMYDVVTPGYRNAKRTGQIIMNPMHKVISEMPIGSTGPAQITKIAADCVGFGPYNRIQDYEPYGWGFNLYHGWMDSILAPEVVGPRPTIISGSEAASALKEATTSCLAKRGNPGESNLWESVAEAHKSLSLLSNLFDQASKIASNGALLKKAKAASSAYLLLRYGLGPIIKDVEAIQKGLLKKVGKARFTARGNSRLERTSITSSSFPYSTLFTVTTQNVLFESYEFRAMSLDEYTAELVSNIGFTTKGLITLPWELIPYSFVVDWFANVGEFLNALVPVFGLNQLGSCYVSTHRFVATSTFSNSTPNAAYSQNIGPLATMYWKHEETKRVPVLGLPALVIKSDFKFDKLLRAADAVALVVQRLGGVR